MTSKTAILEFVKSPVEAISLRHVLPYELGQSHYKNYLP